MLQFGQLSGGWFRLSYQKSARAVDLRASGMTDSQLENLCDRRFGKIEGCLFPPTPWLFSASEVYSHGRAFREWLDWPNSLPIPVFSDHGVHFQRDFSRLEKYNEARVHLTWSKWRDNSHNRQFKQVIRVPHPWTIWRRENRVVPSETRAGTVVFMPHTLPGIEYRDYDLAHLIQEVNISEIDDVRAIMIAMPDVHRGLHRHWRKFGVPIISAGASSSPFFIERFYQLVRQFKFAVSPTVGTSAFICEELGLPVHVKGEEFQFPRAAIEQHGDRFDVFREQMDKYIAIFRNRGSFSDEFIQGTLSDVLGVGLQDTELRNSIKSIFWREVRQPAMYARKLRNVLFARKR